jgi:GNAT superfamily N-acetyltransferase
VIQIIIPWFKSRLNFVLLYILTGSCCALPNSQILGYISTLVVSKQFRGRGIGSCLLQKACDKLGQRNLILDASLGMEAFYVHKGFFMDGNGISYTDIDTRTKPNLTFNIFAGQIEEIVQRNVDKVVAYDAQLFPFKRMKFMKQWLLGSEHVSYVATNRHGRVQGFIVYIPTLARLSSFYADDIFIAQALISKMLQVAFSPNLRITFPSVNIPAIRSLLGVLGATFTEHRQATYRMCTHPLIKFPWEKIFGIANHVSEIA